MGIFRRPEAGPLSIQERNQDLPFQILYPVLLQLAFKMFSTTVYIFSIYYLQVYPIVL